MGDRKPDILTGEPTPPHELPECPPHLDTEAQAEWQRIVPALARLGILRAIDRAALAAYCMSWSRWVAAEGELRKTGLVVRSPQGGAVQSPYLAVARGALREMHLFLSEFGLSPVSRARLLAGDALDFDTAEDLDALLPPLPLTIVARKFERMAFADRWTDFCCLRCDHASSLLIGRDDYAKTCPGCGEPIRVGQENVQAVLMMGGEDHHGRADDGR